MCGIVGWIDPWSGTDRATLESIASAMADALAHRGPDDSGVWSDPAAGIVLGHRRLSILDLSPAGHQPMSSRSGRFVISYNGEIYNCDELRQRLRQTVPYPEFRGHSDTEVMLAAFEMWGIEAGLQRMNGMFAFALWDRGEHSLVLARDRFGEKPLYYGHSQGAFLFASELKALRRHPAFRGEIDRGALSLYLQFAGVPAPHCIYRGIYKLLPGTILRYRNGEVRTSEYWSLRGCVDRAALEPFQGSEDEAMEELDALLRDAVRLRMHADVPVGAFLSGGIDSSLIVSLMQAQRTRPVRTFTVGFADAAYDETADARAAARHLGTEHTEIQVSPAEAMATIPRLPEIYDEPFGDSSQIPTLLISQLARSQVTVSLSGDGGDEVFGGYNRHTWGGALWRSIQTTPCPLRLAAAAAIKLLPASSWQAAFDGLHGFLPAALEQRTPGYKLHQIAQLLSSRHPAELYTRMASHWMPADRIIPASEAHGCGQDSESGWPGGIPFALQAMFRDTVTYLPNDILVKLDRATMACSLEGRVPYLDPRVVEFSWRLPLPMKVRARCGKRILRGLLQRYLPKELVEKPKMGFAIPLDTWLRTSLRDWAEAMLDAKRIEGEGFFDATVIRNKWSEHLRGRGIWQHHLWDVLMFEAWLDHQAQTTQQLTRAAAAS